MSHSLKAAFSNQFSGPPEILRLSGLDIPITGGASSITPTSGIKKSLWSGQLNPIYRLLVIFLLMVACSRTVDAQLYVEEDETFDGTTLVVNPAHGLFVTHTSNNPLLTLTNNANTSGVQAVVLGLLTGESGNLLINGGSVLTNNGNGTSLGTYGSYGVTSGWAYFGHNANTTGTATVTGSGSSWSNSHGLLVGFFGNGELSVLNGGSVSNAQGYIGYGTGSHGIVTVSGAGSILRDNSNFTVGYAGTGTVLVEKGASLVTGYNSSSDFGTLIGHLANSVGTVTISGPGSTWTSSGPINVGWGGTGNLIVENGGSTTTGGFGVGTSNSFSNNPSGYALVTGAGSTLKSGSFTVGGLNGTGELVIANGGQFTNPTSNNWSTSSIGNRDGQGIVKVTGTGSLLHHRGGVFVGGPGRGRGELTIEAGGQVHIQDSNLPAWMRIGEGKNWGAGPGTANGKVTVTGPGSSLRVNGSLTIATDDNWHYSKGELNVLNGGFARVDASTSVGEGFLGEEGKILIDGPGSTFRTGSLIVGGSSGVGFGEVKIRNDGSLIVDSSLVVRSRGRMILDNGHLSVPYYEVNGGLFGSGTLNGRIVCFGNLSLDDSGFGIIGKLKNGHVSGGSSAGGTDGELVIKETSTVSIPIGGTSGPGDGSSDPFGIIDGLNESLLSLEGGFLQLALINDFIPDSTDTFDIFQDFVSVSGNFGNTVFGGVGQLDRVFFDQGSFAIEYGQSYVRLSDFQAVPEPAAGLLVGLSAIGFCLNRRRNSSDAC
jgi:T5SS/PEP-CTERM-associated repeat protein